MEYRLRRNDGEYRWILDTGVPRFNLNGSFAGYIGSCLDITERMRAEEARFRHAAIVESSEDAIISKNLDTVIVSWNAGAQRLFGYTEAEAIGQPITILIPPELRDEENMILEQLRAGERIEHYETTRVTKAGRKVDVSLIISPIKDSTGKLVGFCKLAHDITERKRAEQLLRETNCALETQTGVLQSREELLKIFVKSVPAGVAMLDRDMRYLQVSDRWCADYGVASSQILGRSHYELFPDVPQRWKEMHRRALEGETLRADEDRWDRGGGTTAWVRWEIRPWTTPGGVVGGILIFAEDITRRKQMEEAISGVSGRLIEAQERERDRIARDLHDDVCQQLALVSIGLEEVQRKFPDSVSEHRSQVGELRNRIMDIATDVQMMSHELHSAKLSYLGAAVAMKGFCREFGEHHKFEIEFDSHDVPRQLPPDVSLCLFRVLQEALHNAAKHSGVKRFDVQLWGTSGDIHLTISDRGSGFDSKTAMQDRGLGLTSMQERVRLVNGRFAIESKPMYGTTIRVQVPLVSGHEQQRAAG
jgi:PAS domain S-box-containing protein